MKSLRCEQISSVSPLSTRQMQAPILPSRVLATCNHYQHRFGGHNGDLHSVCNELPCELPDEHHVTAQPLFCSAARTSNAPRAGMKGGAARPVAQRLCLSARCCPAQILLVCRGSSWLEPPNLQRLPSHCNFAYKPWA